MNRYKEMKDRQGVEINDFPMAFAFSDKQFEEGMAKLGLKPEDTDKVWAIPNTGGFYRRDDAEAFHEMFDRHWGEYQAAIAEDITGEGFIYEMFRYELENHEFGYTWDVTDTLRALGLDKKDLEKSEALRNGLAKAVAYIREYEEKRA